ncbi:hypothetical protein PINS_up000194 [Pythium insidiosum]|nr:hypothetical protein PINS_up000194 [Pythium insidiosum]
MKGRSIRTATKSRVKTLDASCKTRKKAYAGAQRDNVDFYSNMWESPANEQNRKQFIDISQVAYALSALDYKDDYDHAGFVPDLNFWDDDLIDDSDERLSRTSSRNALAPLSAATRLNDTELVVGDAVVDESVDSSKLSQCKTLQKLLSNNGTIPVLSIPVPAPSRHNGNQVVFSSVLSRVELKDTWSVKFLLSLHEPIRHALYVIDRFLERSQQRESPREWSASSFFEWFTQCFAEFVKGQKVIKAQVLRPHVPVKFTTKREILECYDEIGFVLDAIALQEDFLKVAAAAGVRSWHERLAVLQIDIRKLNVLLLHVLDLEEQVYQPALMATFTEDAFNKYVVPRVFRAAHPRRVVIPWIIERSKVWGGPKEASHYRKQLSLTARFLYDRVWFPFFSRHIADAMKTLDATLIDSPEENVHESWLACVIQ